MFDEVVDVFPLGDGGLEFDAEVEATLAVELGELEQM